MAKQRHSIQSTDYKDQRYQWYTPYLYYVRNPLRLFTTPLGWLAGKIIVQEQYSDPSLPSITSRHGFKSNYWLHSDPQQAGEDNITRKIVVMFGGNGLNFYPEDGIKGFDFATVFHPVWPSSADAEIECGETLIQKLIYQENYKPENIIILGHSLGGGVATQVVRRCRENKVLKDDQQFDRLILSRTFSTLSSAATFLTFGRLFYDIPMTNGGEARLGQLKAVRIARTIIRGFLRLIGWEMDTVTVLKNETLPVKHTYILTAENDQVLGNMSAISQDEVSRKSPITFRNSLPGGHNNLTLFNDNTLYPQVAVKNIDQREVLNPNAQSHHITNMNSLKNQRLLQQLGLTK